MQELIPFPGGVAAHGGEDRLRLGNRGSQLLPQCVDFGGELVDDRANVVGDLLDFVFVLVGQKLPDLFESGRRVADARQQIQDRRVDRVDLCRIGSELSRD
jgi:hypothetical protein